jgi:pilus assembly protein CpaB
MLLFAATLAVISGFAAQTWLEQQRLSGVPVIVEKRVPTGTIVVANEPLRFGTELSSSNVREIEWAAGSTPDGAFTSTAELLRANERRVVLSAIETNEPILKWKITGPGQRASLSAVLEEGMKAVTIRVNDVNGIAGFVLPGDRVDVLLTRTERDPNNANGKSVFNDVILQNVRVLGIDQLADDRTEQAVVAKAVTLEVSTVDAQRVALASNVGKLSLALRPAGLTAQSITQRISDDDLVSAPNLPAASSPGSAGLVTGSISRSRKVTVTRLVHRTEYTVSPEPKQSRFGTRNRERSFLGTRDGEQSRVGAAHLESPTGPRIRESDVLMTR